MGSKFFNPIKPPCEKKGLLPTVILKPNDQIDITCADIKTAPITGEGYRFNLNLIKYSDSNLQNKIVISGYLDSLILTINNPLSLTFKKKIFLKTNKQSLKISIQKNPSKIRVVNEYPNQLNDYDVDFSFPNFKIHNLITDKVQNSKFVLETNFKEILILTTSSSCKPCFESFKRFVKNKQNPNLLVILAFPSNTSKKQINKYTTQTNSNILICSTDIDMIRNRYGLYSLPEGILFDSEGQIKKIHVTLDSFF